jgi:hypothetical protein
MQQQYSLLSQSVVTSALNLMLVVSVVGVVVCLIQLGRWFRSRGDGVRPSFGDVVNATEKRWLRVAATSSDAELAVAMFRIGLARGAYEPFRDALHRFEYALKARKAAQWAARRAVSMAAEVDPTSLATWIDESSVVHIRTPHALEHTDQVEELARAAADGARVRIHDTERPPAAPLEIGDVVQLRRPS